jgi:hypothetical protein
MKLSRMGKPSYLKAHHLQKDDLLEIMEEPYTQSAEESKYGRERGYAVVRLVRTGDLFTYGMNGTTWDHLLDAYGDDSALWKGKKIKMTIEKQTIRGESKDVMFGVPYKEDIQKPLEA